MKQFAIYWAPGEVNLGDYYTKHHAPAHHQRMRPIYLHCANVIIALPTALRGCVDTRFYPRLNRDQRPMQQAKPMKQANPIGDMDWRSKVESRIATKQPTTSMIAH